MKLGTWAYPSTASVEPPAGSGPYGDAYGDPYEIRCAVDETVRLVRDPAGSEVTSSTTLLCPPDVEVPSGARVTVRGRVATVIASRLPDAPLGGVRQRIVSLT
ncbi:MULTISPECIES: hypothetical protein [unclassified Egicoccus]|uniref:hypothetical protein n=1 Tax=unclassified Egicoccus TaxID=2635606 RepID=UPI00359F029F